MREVRNIAGRTVAEIDRAATRWLQSLGQPDEIRAGDVAFLRRMALAACAGGICVPFALSWFLPASIALPVGTTIVGSVFLGIVAAIFASGRRPKDEPLPVVTSDPVFDACPGLSLILDARGVVVKCGGRDRQSFPADLQDCVGQRLVDHVHVSDRIALVHAIDTLRQGVPGANVNIRVHDTYCASAGRQFVHARLEMTALPQPDGVLGSIFAQLRDVSVEEAHKQEATQRISEARSAHEAKTRFLAAVSHELRTPLNAILGFSEVLAGEYFGRLETDRQKEYVGLIRQSGDHLLSLVNTMLDMSKIESGRYQLFAEAFPVDEIMETCRAMLDLQARGKGVTLAARTAKGLNEVIADQRAVKQILINLAGNAVKFTDNGGVVNIDALQEGNNLVLTVSDTGIGIPADKLDLLGQPFMQVQDGYTRQHEGTGLGLSLVKGLVALHGGLFHIKSDAGVGTVVTVTLPADGSGIAAPEEEQTDPMVAFPPVLLKTTHAPLKDQQDRRNDDAAKAKIA